MRQVEADPTQVLHVESQVRHRLSGDETNEPGLHGPQLELTGFLYQPSWQLRQSVAAVPQVAQLGSHG